MPVHLDVSDTGCATLHLDRPQKRNALDRDMLVSLRDRVEELRTHPRARVVVVRGSGGVFCAGADINDWVDPGPQIADELSRLGADTFAALGSLPQPSVAVLEGPAVGGGLELALACDLRIAATTAIIGFPEARLGNLPSWGGLARLVQTAGMGATRHLLLTGATVGGSRAERLGVVTGLAEPADLSRLVGQTVADLLACDATAHALAKRVLAGYDRPITTEAAFASLTAMLPSSRERKNDFLTRKAAARKSVPAAPARQPESITEQ
jgi:enoyl-CoA hydratase/carnithine racemase